METEMGTNMNLLYYFAAIAIISLGISIALTVAILQINANTKKIRTSTYLQTLFLKKLAEHEGIVIELSDKDVEKLKELKFHVERGWSYKNPDKKQDIL